MGLDMYAYAVEQGKKVDLGQSAFWDWRKNNALHGWMAELYDEKGGDDEEFNCVPVHLEFQDLEKLREDILADRLKPTEGFFFGAQIYTEEEKADDLEFVQEAMELITAGKDIYYYAWY